MPGRTNAPHQFMAPYPASLFKLLVAFQVVRMVDAGGLTLDTAYTYAGTNAPPETRPIRDWMEPMITISDNRATYARLQMLHRHRRVDVMNREFAELGLVTLQVNGTRPADGYGWQTDRMHMTAFDPARLLLLIEGPAGELWKTPAGRTVRAEYLSGAARRFLKHLLEERG